MTGPSGARDADMGALTNRKLDVNFQAMGPAKNGVFEPRMFVSSCIRYGVRKRFILLIRAYVSVELFASSANQGACTEERVIRTVL